MSKVNLQSLEKVDSMPTKGKISPVAAVGKNCPRSYYRDPEYWIKFRAVKRAGINKPWEETVKKLKEVLPEREYWAIHEDKVQLDKDGIPRLVDSHGDYRGNVPTDDLISSSRYDCTFVDLEGILRKVFYRRFHFTPKNIKSLRQQRRKQASHIKACKQAADYNFVIATTTIRDEKNKTSTVLGNKIQLQVDGATVPVKTYNPSNGIWEHQGATAPQYTYFTVKEFMYFCEVRKQTYALEVDGQFLTNVKL